MLDLTDPATVKFARRALGMSLQELADALELEGPNAADTVRFWENGKRTPSGPARVAIRLLLERLET
jgi:DNA-binding transcriptional regulator YiaG